MIETTKVKLIEIKDEDWDFTSEDTQYLTHGLHPYPARMVPQIAGRLLRRFASRNDVVLDPFCGSGGVLVEARLAGVNSIGIDINPLACLLAEVKSNPIHPDTLSSIWKELKSNVTREITSLRFKEIDVEVPDFSGTNINYWFKPTTMKELSIIRRNIEAIEERELRRFFEVPFSLTVREVSGTRKKEYKLYRLPEEEWRRYSPNVLNTFIDYTEKAIQKMVEFYREASKDVFSKVFMADTRFMLTEKFPKEANDLLIEKPPKIIITSPPYGDSRTTVAYGQFSRLSSLWLNFEPEFKKEIIMNVDKLSLGGDTKDNIKLNVDLPILCQTIDMIRKRDEERALETMAYFSDLYKCLERMYTCLDKGGVCCIVIANRTVKRVLIPTHAIIAEMGVEIGFQDNVIIIPRNIPMKRLPWENAPENIPGLKGKTMSKEHIIIMQKNKM
jgi:SAM-dependent methyltransferase